MYLEEGRKNVMAQDFFERKHKEYQEWLQKDLVVDTRETWRSWMTRQMSFKDAPLVPREELPEEFHPHRSFYGKVTNTLHGIDPTPPEN